VPTRTQIIAAIAELIATALVGILADRWLSTRYAVGLLCVCGLIIGWHHWTDIRSIGDQILIWAPAHRAKAVMVCAVVVLLLAAGFGYLVLKKPHAAVPTSAPSSQERELIGQVLIASADPFVRFYQHPPAYFERVDTHLYVVITNQTNIPIYIEGYSVLALVGGQQWRVLQNLPPFGLEPDEIGFLAPNRAYLNRIDLNVNGFDCLMRKGPIGPHQALQAWMFFKSGLSASEIFRVTQFKITMLDSTGKRYVLFSDFPNKTMNFAVGKLRVLPREPVPRNLRQEP
jgi:hypothetical protein